MPREAFRVEGQDMVRYGVASREAVMGTGGSRCGRDSGGKGGVSFLFRGGYMSRPSVCQLSGMEHVRQGIPLGRLRGAACAGDAPQPAGDEPEASIELG